MNRTAEVSKRASSLPLHQKTTREIAGHTCTIYVQERPAFLLIQPADANDLREMDQEVEAIAQATGAHFVLVAVHIARWFDELPPWDAPPVFGKRPFGHGAPATLQSILDIIDHLRSSGIRNGSTMRPSTLPCPQPSTSVWATARTDPAPPS